MWSLQTNLWQHNTDMYLKPGQTSTTELFSIVKISIFDAWQCSETPLNFNTPLKIKQNKFTFNVSQEIPAFMFLLKRKFVSFLPFLNNGCQLENTSQYLDSPGTKLHRDKFALRTWFVVTVPNFFEAEFLIVNPVVLSPRF